jgi:NOL1/NOP2/fmu family ribosome biogenesis protein
LKITIFAPFAQITVHNLAEIKLAEILINNGHEVTFIQCDKSFIDQCTVLDANGVDPKSEKEIKEKFCRECVGQRNNYRKLPSLKYISTKSLENNHDIPTIPTDVAGIIDFELQGIKIGKIASFETLIKFKKSNFDFNSDQIEHLRSWMTSAVKSYYIAKKYFELYKTDLVIAYSPQYNIPGIFTEVAHSLGIRTLAMDGSGRDFERYSHIRLHDWNVYGLKEPALFHLDQFKKYSPNKKSLKKANQQAREFPNTKSFNAYSKNKQKKNTFDFFNETLSGVYCYSIGTEIGELKEKRFAPSEFLPFAQLLQKEDFPLVDLEHPDALKYLAKNPIMHQSNERGYVLLSFNDVVIGFGKFAGNRINNLFPAEWKLRLMPPEDKWFSISK